MNQLRKTLAVALVVTVGCVCVAAERARAQGPERGLLLRAMEEELQRSMNELSGNADPPPYFMSYSVTETEQTRLASSYGALRAARLQRARGHSTGG
jgi:hypothetical protein